MERYICIHGHFYQPPRENPWLETIERQDSAHPYHDWNERISAECYTPNAFARILDGEELITDIVNNYSKISFNFGPTLLSWLQYAEPETYNAILTADRDSQERFSGHGSAMAQAYNHLIMPLANSRDKYTQIAWGIEDFKKRFGRMPEGMWLPETAVDLETLDIMAEQGIKFTVLSPYQAGQVRPLEGGDWQEVVHVDPSMAYRQKLPSGRTISLFFYDGPVSQAVAFEHLLMSGEKFAHRIANIFDDSRDWAQIAHIATDGESYGHHHRQGEMALAYALSYVESQDIAQLTNYGEYLEKHPPTYEVQIIEDTSWSCFHGIERWRSDCGCNTGGRPEWNQSWRAPLRDALDWLRDMLIPLYENKAGKYLRDPWAARNDYIQMILDRSPENLELFLGKHALRELNPADKVTVLKLLEIQRHAMLMYTSCGWFFDELSGIETVQVIQYAGRAIQLAEQALGEDIEEEFLAKLSMARSNIPDHRDGAHIYQKFVKPSIVDLQNVGAHYAVSSLFETYDDKPVIYCYTIDKEEQRIIQTGNSRLMVGWAKVISNITYDSAALSFGVLHFGDHNLTGGVREFQSEEAYQKMVEEVSEAFERANLPETIRLLDKHFLELTYSLRSLFGDERRKILDLVLETTLTEAGTTFRQLYRQNAPLMRFLTDLGTPLPKVFHATAEFVLNANLREAFEQERLDFDNINTELDSARREGISLDGSTLGYVLEGTFTRLIKEFYERPAESVLLNNLTTVADLTNILPFSVNLVQVQNIYHEMRQTTYPDFLQRAEQGNEEAQAWIFEFNSLGEKLRFRV